MDNLTPKFSSGSHVPEHANRLYRESCDNLEILKFTLINLAITSIAALASVIAAVAAIFQVIS